MEHRTAFIIVDVQNDFCEGGSLAVEGGNQVARDITAHLREHGDRYEAIVATRDYHIDPGGHWSDEPDFVDSWPKHCEADTPGASFHPALDVVPIEAVFSKGEHEAAYSGFEGTGDRADDALATWLRDRGIDRVVIGGLATDHCVRATALDAAKEGFETIVAEDLVAGVAPETVEKALAEMSDAGVGFAPAEKIPA